MIRRYAKCYVGERRLMEPHEVFRPEQLHYIVVFIPGQGYFAWNYDTGTDTFGPPVTPPDNGRTTVYEACYDALMDGRKVLNTCDGIGAFTLDETPRPEGFHYP